jgi:hypothetical protein
MSNRRKLTEIEKEQARRWIATTQTQRLYPKQRECFLSIKSYFEWDEMLSDRQLLSLRKAKQTTERMNYKMRQPKQYDVTSKLDTIFNPMK